MRREEGVLLLDDGLPVVSVLGVLLCHVDVLLLKDVLTLQGKPCVIISSIAGMDVVLLEVVLISVTDKWLVQICLLRHIGNGSW